MIKAKFVARKAKILVAIPLAFLCCFYVAFYFLVQVPKTNIVQQLNNAEYHDANFQQFFDDVKKYSKNQSIDNFNEMLANFEVEPVYLTEELEHEFDERWRRVGNVCKTRYKLPNDPSKNRARVSTTIAKSYTINSAFFVDDKNKILFCLIPKVASSELKQLLMYLSADSPYDTFEELDDNVHNSSYWRPEMAIKPLRYYSKNVKEVALRLTNYTKVMWVRHPLIRLVSAWNSKLTGRNSFYFNEFGVKILQRYRNMTKEKAKNQSSVTLEEFFKYIRDNVVQTKMSDVHWSTYNLQCMPCFLQYDYILSLENWYPETHFFFKNYIKHARGSLRYEHEAFENIAKQLTVRNAAGDEKWRQILKTLPPDLVIAVTRIFAFDASLYGYDMNLN